MPDNDAATELSNYLKTTGQFNRQILPALSVVNRNVVNLVNAKKSFSDLPGNERSTLHNIVLAWLLTLPVCVLLGATTFAAGLYTMFKLFGLK